MLHPDEQLDQANFLPAAISNFVQQVRYTTLASGGVVEDWDGIVVCNAYSPHRYRNVAVPTRQLRPEELADLGGRLADFYGNTDGWIIDSFFPLSPPNDQLIWDGDETVMFFPGDPVIARRVDELRIEEVTTNEAMAEFENVWATAFDKPHLLSPSAVRYDTRILGDGQRLWIGRVGDTAVATAGSYTAAGLNLIRSVTTLQQYRGRGIGASMTVAAMNASELPRYLNCHPGADNLYQRIGFNAASTFQYWRLNTGPNQVRLRENL